MRKLIVDDVSKVQASVSNMLAMAEETSCLNTVVNLSDTEHYLVATESFDSYEPIKNGETLIVVSDENGTEHIVVKSGEKLFICNGTVKDFVTLCCDYTLAY